MSRPGGAADGSDASTSARSVRIELDDTQLRSEWEYVRRQRKALEKKKQQSGNRDATTRCEEAVGDDDDDDDAEQRWILATQAQPITDPLACLCRCNLKKIGQSYVLRERRVLRQGRLKRELILVGPHWIGVCVTLSILLGCTAMFLYQQCSLLPWYYSLITLGFCGMTLYYLYGVACVDPGIVFPPSSTPSKRMKPTMDHDTTRETTTTTVTVLDSDDDDDDDDQALVRNNGHASDDLENTSASRARVLNSNNRPTVILGNRSFSPRAARFCDVCEITQDAYTEHCDDCGVCIRDYDHHCPWMGKCIGQNNMYAFKMFNLSWVLYVVFVLGVSIQTVDWGDVAVQRLHRLSTGEWVPLGVGNTNTPTPTPTPTHRWR